MVDKEANTIVFKEFNLQNQLISEYYTKNGKEVKRKAVLTSWNLAHFIKNFLFDVFLPQGYPDSVSDDYTWYQVWDTLQACCSTLSGMLAVQAVLMGVGVGRDNATPLAAALAWFTKDGIGMITGISFAWLKGTSLDSECKKWRLFADVINDVALCIELSISVLLDKALLLLCVSSAIKAIVGVAGGATRAALTHHQATRGNTADVAAKDGSQETLVNLTAMSAGIWLINTDLVQQNIWGVMALLVAAHIYCNYKAVKSLRLRKFNEERFVIAAQSYLLTNEVPTVAEVNCAESVVLGAGTSSKTFCGFTIVVGETLQAQARATDGSLMQTLLLSHREQQYLLVPRPKHITVALRPDVSNTAVLQAYFHALLLGSLLHKEDLNYPRGSPLGKLIKSLERYQTSSDDVTKSAVLCCAEAAERYFLEFQRLCEDQKWIMNEHVIRIDQWRVEWDNANLPSDKAEKMA